MDLTKLLVADEEVVVLARRHPIVVAGPLALAIVVIVIALVAGAILTPESGSDAVDLVGGGLAVLATLRAVSRWLAWRGEVMAFTDRRVLHAAGIIRRRVDSVPLGHIHDVVYRRTMTGRLLGYGDLELITGAEQGVALYLDRLRRPRRLYLVLAALLAPPGSPPLVVPPDAEDTGPLPRIVV